MSFSEIGSQKFWVRSYSFPPSPSALAFSCLMVLQLPHPVLLTIHSKVWSLNGSLGPWPGGDIGMSQIQAGTSGMVWLNEFASLGLHLSQSHSQVHNWCPSPLNSQPPLPGSRCSRPTVRSCPTFCIFVLFITHGLIYLVFEPAFFSVFLYFVFPFYIIRLEPRSWSSHEFMVPSWWNPTFWFLVLFYTKKNQGS